MSICPHGRLECRCPMCSDTLIDDMLDRIKTLEGEVKILKLSNAKLNVFSLYEVEKYEGAHMHALFGTRVAALKSGLALKRKRVEQALIDYRLTGTKENEWWYIHCWDNIKICVEAEKVNN